MRDFSAPSDTKRNFLFRPFPLPAQRQSLFRAVKEEVEFEEILRSAGINVARIQDEFENQYRGTDHEIKDWKMSLQQKSGSVLL